MKLKNKEFFNRLVQIIITLFGISFLTFLLIHLAPGDPVLTMFTASGNIPSAEVIEKTREAMGLNEPFFVQYFNWLTSVLSGDLGESFSLGKPVSEIITPRLTRTLNLALVAILFTVLLSFPLGVLSAVYVNKPVDYIIRGLTGFGISAPSFFVGTMLLYVFALKLNLFPVVSVGGGIDMIILPAATLAISMSAKYTRQIRSIVLEELKKPYVIGATARGISFIKILVFDVLVNVLVPIVTLFGMSLGSLLAGVAVVEVIFSYPGLGSMAVDAITAYDYALVQAYVLLISIIYMSVNFIVDISYKYLDPRTEKRI